MPKWPPSNWNGGRDQIGISGRLRWNPQLLMAHDRAEGDDLPVTQEFLALMLCVYRPSVTVAAGILQRAGIIQYSRGHIAVLDRDSLEALACGCYVVVKRRYNTLLGSHPGQFRLLWSGRSKRLSRPS
jgi:hypothetical protein